MYSCKRLFGLLSDRTGASSESSGPPGPEPAPDRVVAEVEVQRAGQRLERGGEQRRPATPAALRLALAQQEVLAKLDAAGEPGEPGGRHDSGTAGRQRALVVIGMACVQRLGDGQVHDGVAEELEPFVVAAARRPGARAATRSGRGPAPADRGRGREPEALGDGLSGTHLGRGRPARRSARRCSRRRPGRSGSSRRPRPRSRYRTLPPGS